MFCLTIHGDIKPTLSKEMLELKKKELLYDTVTNLMIFYGVLYIQYYGSFPVRIFRMRIKQVLKDYKIPCNLHNEITQDIFRILKNQYDVKYRKLDIHLYSSKLLEEMKNVQFKI